MPVAGNIAPATGGETMLGTCSTSEIVATGYLQLCRNYVAPYVRMGAGDPIIVVPGLAGGVGLLEPLMEELSQTHQVIAYELRGEGEDFFDRDFTLSQLVRDLDTLIGSLGFERPGLLGLSFGGAIALEYASRWPGKLSYVAVQGAGARFEPGLFGQVAQEVLGRVCLPENNPFINQFFSVLIGDRRRPGDRFDFVVDRCWRTDQWVMAHRLGLLEGFDLTPNIASIRVPALVLAGERDVVVPPGEAGRLAEGLPMSQLEEIPHAGHLAFVTHPHEVARRIRDFHHIVTSS